MISTGDTVLVGTGKNEYTAKVIGESSNPTLVKIKPLTGMWVGSESLLAARNNLRLAR